MKKYDESIKAFEDALDLRMIESVEAENRATAQEAKLKMAKIRHNIGCVNFELDKLDEAKRNYDVAIQEQRGIFGTWTASIMLLTDTSKPGYLTMASTMCNRGEYACDAFDFLALLSNVSSNLLMFFHWLQATLILSKKITKMQLKSS